MLQEWNVTSDPVEVKIATLLLIAQLCLTVLIEGHRTNFVTVKRNAKLSLFLRDPLSALVTHCCVTQQLGCKVLRRFWAIGSILGPLNTNAAST